MRLRKENRYQILCNWLLNLVFDKKQIDKLGKKLKIYNISNSFEFVNNFNKTFNINVQLEDLINKGLTVEIK